MRDSTVSIQLRVYMPAQQHPLQHLGLRMRSTWMLSTALRIRTSFARDVLLEGWGMWQLVQQWIKMANNECSKMTSTVPRYAITANRPPENGSFWFVNGQCHPMDGFLSMRINRCQLNAPAD